MHAAGTGGIVGSNGSEEQGWKGGRGGKFPWPGWTLCRSAAACGSLLALWPKHFTHLLVLD